MTAFDDLFAPARAQLAALFAPETGATPETVTYAAPGGAAAPVTGTLWAAVSADLAVGQQGEAVIEVFEVLVPAAQVAAPAQYGIVARGANSYVVERVLSVPGGQWQLTVTRSLPEEKSHEAYRLRR